jgi:hypothetical protein
MLHYAIPDHLQALFPSYEPQGNDNGLRASGGRDFPRNLFADNSSFRERGISQEIKEHHGRLLYFCDWLPLDFDAVGQYAILIACKVAAQEYGDTLAGLFTLLARLLNVISLSR